MGQIGGTSGAEFLEAPLCARAKQGSRLSGLELPACLHPSFWDGGLVLAIQGPLKFLRLGLLAGLAF